MRYLFIPLVVVLAALAACTSRPAPANIQRFPLTGRVLSITISTSSVSVDTDPIPNFMPAMSMDYKVKNSDEIKPLKTGDSISAMLVKQDDEYWLENVHATAKTAAPPANQGSR